MDLFRPGADLQKGRERNNNTNVNHLQMSLKRYELSVPSFRWFTDLRFIKVSPKDDQKPLLPLEGLLVAFEWWLYSTLAADGEFTWRTRRSSPEIRYLLAHKCQKSPRFSASELGRRGTPAALQSISRRAEERGFAIHTTLSSSSAPAAVSSATLSRCLVRQLLTVLFLLQHPEVFFLFLNPRLVSDCIDWSQTNSSDFPW